MELWVYILRCADGSFYVGSTKKPPAAREWEHNQGVVEGYTLHRRPVQLVYCENYERLTEGHARERQLKGWSRAKKQALIAGQPDRLPELARPVPRTPPSTGSG